MIRNLAYLGIALAFQALGDRDTAQRAYERRDFHKALREWQELAKAGDAEAEFKLGSMYEKGEGTQRDLRQAVRWYWKSAYQGFGQSQSSLGMLYAAGRGVPKDNIQAHFWLSLASRNGVAEAAKQCDALAPEMSSADMTESQRLANNWEPAIEIHDKASAPVVVRHVSPDDETARLAGYSGAVMLDLIIDSNGNPRDALVYQGISAEVNARVVRAVLQWKFKPIQRNGRAITVQTPVEFRFEHQPYKLDTGL